MSSQILHDNYLEDSAFAEIEVSSELAGFPATNTYEYTRRTKIWRTSGHFEVKAGANTIIFQETIGVNLTATVAVGHYATFATFAAAVKAALEVPGTPTYTVSQDSTTKKIKIASNGATLRLMWTNPSSAGMAAVLGFSTAADDINATTYTADFLRTMTDEYFFIDFGMAVNPDAVVVSWRTDERTKISGVAVVTLSASYTNNFVSPPYVANLVKTDYGFSINKGLSTNDGISPSAYRFWRIQIADPSNPYGQIDIGSIFMGKWMNFERGKIQFPFNMNYQTGSVSQITEGGQALGQKKYTTRSFNAEWFGLTQSEKDLVDEFVYEVSTTKPFYIMLDSGTVLSESPEKSLLYCRLSDPPEWTMDFPGVYSCSMSLREDL